MLLFLADIYHPPPVLVGFDFIYSHGVSSWDCRTHHGLIQVRSMRHQRQVRAAERQGDGFVKHDPTLASRPHIQPGLLPGLNP